MRTLLLLSLSVCAFGQVTFSSIRVDKVTATQARIQFATDVSISTSWIEWSTDCAALSSPAPWHSSNKSVGGVIHGETIQGLKPGTDYCYRVCTTGPICSAIQSPGFTTLSATDAELFRDPDQPQNVPTVPAMPTSYDQIFTVTPGTNCSNFQSILDSMATKPNGNYLITLPAGETCRSFWIAPARTATSGYAVVRTSAPDSALPPEGTAVPRSWPDSVFATLATTDTNGSAMEARGYGWRFVGIKFTNDTPSNAYKTVTAVSGGTITVPGHGLTTDRLAQFYSDAGGYIRNAKVTRIDDDNLSIQASYATSGTIAAGWKMAATAKMYSILFKVDWNATTPANNIILDRCKFALTNPMPYGLSRTAVQLHGNQLMAVNNRFDDIISWRGLDPVNGSEDPFGDYSGPNSITFDYGDGFLLQNNTATHPGLNFFMQEVNGTGAHQNVLFRRNRMAWDRQYFPGYAEWDGLDHTTRQQFELKRGRRIKLIGNDFGRQYQTKNITGNFAMNIVVTPRVSTGNIQDSGNAVTDLIIEYNTFHDSPGMVNIAGADGSNLPNDVEGTQRVLFRHNLAYNLNSYTQAWPTPLHGHCFYLGVGIQSFRAEHNTCWDARGDSAEFFYFADERGAAWGIENNLVGINAVKGANWTTGTSGLFPALVTTGSMYNMLSQMTAQYPTSPDPKFRFRNNVFVGGPGLGASADYNGTGITKAQCDALLVGAPTSNICLGATGETASQRYNRVKFFDRTTTNNFRLQYTSPVITYGSDGLPVGADVDRLDIEMGKVKNVHSHSISGGTMKISYVTPDAEACDIDKSALSVLGTAGASGRSSDGGGSRRRTVTVAGVDTAPYVWVLCKREIYSCPTTGTGGDCSLVE